MRAFIALDLPAKIRRGVSLRISALKEFDADVRWVRPDQLHLTLKFLGGISESQVFSVKDFLDDAAANFPAQALSLSKIGAFPSFRYPDVLWTGLSSGENELVSLAGIVDQGLTTLGFAADSKPFKPHLTLGRVRSPKNMEFLIEQIGGLDFAVLGSFVADQITLYQSLLSSGGSVYTPIHRVTLK